MIFEIVISNASRPTHPPTHSLTHSLTHWAILTVVLFATGPGCGKDESLEDDDEAGDTGEPELPDNASCLCNFPSESSYPCVCTYTGSGVSFDNGFYCAQGQNSATSLCDAHCESLAFNPDGAAEPELPCDEQASAMSCTGWDPGSSITYLTGSDLYVIDWGFAVSLYADSEALIGCDDATILLGENGFEVAQANSGELLYELGLRNGDILVSINNLDLDTFADANAALVDLWLEQGEVSYTLEIERNSSPMELDYYIAATL
jgi:hypothetical protein